MQIFGDRCRDLRLLPFTPNTCSVLLSPQCNQIVQTSPVLFPFIAIPGISAVYWRSLALIYYEIQAVSFYKLPLQVTFSKFYVFFSFQFVKIILIKLIFGFNKNAAHL